MRACLHLLPLCICCCCTRLPNLLLLLLLLFTSKNKMLLLLWQVTTKARAKQQITNRQIQLQARKKGRKIHFTTLPNILKRKLLPIIINRIWKSKCAQHWNSISCLNSHWKPLHQKHKRLRLSRDSSDSMAEQYYYYFIIIILYFKF